MISWVADTNTPLRFLLNDIPKQTQQITIKIKQAKNGKVKLIIPQIVIFEIHFALISSYGFSKQSVIEGLKKIVSVDYLLIQDKDIFKQALELYNRLNISLPDCFIKVYSEYFTAKVFTFDKKLAKLV